MGSDTTHLKGYKLFLNKMKLFLFFLGVFEKQKYLYIEHPLRCLIKNNIQQH